MTTPQNAKIDKLILEHLSVTEKLREAITLDIADKSANETRRRSHLIRANGLITTALVAHWRKEWRTWE